MYTTLPTIEELHRVLIYNPDTGHFIWRQRPERSASWNTQFAGLRAGSVSGAGYRTICINYQKIAEHRLAFAIYYGKYPDNNIDHINLIKDDNRIMNLRDVTTEENSCNCVANCTNKSGYKGVSLCHKGKSNEAWGFFIQRGGVKVHKAGFLTPEEAYAAYLDAAKKLHGEFGRGYNGG